MTRLELAELTAGVGALVLGVDARGHADRPRGVDGCIRRHHGHRSAGGLDHCAEN